jgi:3-oxoacyl-[acyl-carrier-protein] synthase II
MSKRRVVVTGIGLITPLGLNIKDNWNSLITGKSGIKKITKFDVSNSSTKIASTINSEDIYFDPENYIDPKDIKKMDLFIQYGIAAAKEAVIDSGWQPQTDEEKERTGVIVGSGIGGLESIENTAIQLRDTGKISPFFIPSCLINLISGHISIKYDFRGPNHSVVTACATGAHSIGDASRLIKYGDADVMVAGGAEAPITPLGLAGFSSARALSTAYNDTPHLACRPWDKARDGFVMGEGSGILVLEEYEHAKKRGAKIYAEVLGYGLAGDAYHITSSHPEGLGGKRAMISALKDAALNTSDIGYINAHGTSTPIGDASEIQAVQSLFDNDLTNLKMSSTKSAIGHLLGAAGSVEAIYTILALQHQILPPTLNLLDPMDEAKIDLVPLKAKEHKFNYALTNSFGFGGTNTCIALGKI